MKGSKFLKLKCEGSLKRECEIFKTNNVFIKHQKTRSLYKPQNQDEEILLCLTISQHLASKEVMLLRQAQFKQIREHTFNNAVTSLDLLLVFLAYNRCYKIISEVFIFRVNFKFRYDFKK